jgi:hypothetical protein
MGLNTGYYVRARPYFTRVVSAVICHKKKQIIKIECSS